MAVNMVYFLYQCISHGTLIHSSVVVYSVGSQIGLSRSCLCSLLVGRHSSGCTNICTIVASTISFVCVFGTIVLISSFPILGSEVHLQALSHTGLGPSKVSEVFRTALPGRPGSPSHVTATWIPDNKTTLVCWEPSEVGKPFTSYTVEVLDVNSNVSKIWRLRVDAVKDNLPNCTAGYLVSAGSETI